MPRHYVSRRNFLGAASASALGRASYPSEPPNVIFILADDFGYGDLGCYGSCIPTPNIDKMARDGIKFNSYYSGSAVCSPSRASLLTGRYPTRVGVPRVLFPNDEGGLPENETTIANILKHRDYKTMLIGKWHLGSKKGFLPTDRGFDYFYGIPYSNDMNPPLISGTQVLREYADLNRLTMDLTESALKFIYESRNSSFFLLLAYAAPHIPLDVSESFLGKTEFGPYGDVIAEMDFGVGEILKMLDNCGIDKKTLVMFSSDNGPWYEGSTGVFRDRKGECYEGGFRVPLVARFPGQIIGGSECNGISAAIDILPTVANLCGATMPEKPLDGIDIWTMLSGASGEIERDVLLFFADKNLHCGRQGSWKLHVARYNRELYEPPYDGMTLPLPRPELYNLTRDPAESFDTSKRNPEVVRRIRRRMEELLPGFPDDIVEAWRSTMSIPVEDTPTGARPQIKK